MMHDREQSLSAFRDKPLGTKGKDVLQEAFGARVQEFTKSETHAAPLEAGRR